MQLVFRYVLSTVPDAADVVTTLCDGSDWANTIRRAEVKISGRVRGVMPEAVEGFQQWFSS